MPDVINQKCLAGVYQVIWECELLALGPGSAFGRRKPNRSVPRQAHQGRARPACCRGPVQELVDENLLRGFLPHSLLGHRGDQAGRELLCGREAALQCDLFFEVLVRDRDACEGACDRQAGHFTVRRRARFHRELN